MDSLTPERNRLVKKLLAAKYRVKNVRVEGGRGTAYGWVNVQINIGPRLDTTETYTSRECEKMSEVSREAEQILIDNKVEFGSYCDDMNYSHTELNISARFQEVK